MLNQQKPEQPSHRTDGQLAIHSIFGTIQGEGPFTGRVATFVRLAGCNLQCPNCDTEYTDRKMMSVEQIEADLRKKGLVVITGGEPFRQPLEELIDVLVKWGHVVQIETNGTFIPEWLKKIGDIYNLDELQIVVSPKTATLPKGWGAVDREFVSWKYVMHHENVGHDGLPLSVLGNQIAPCRPPQFTPTTSIYLQPEDNRDPLVNVRNRKACIDSCMTHGFNLCLQIQKVVGLP